MPGGSETFFDLLDCAAARGLDVRALFWREPRIAESEPDASHFGGDAADMAFLRERGARFVARWDRLEEGFCQHQKSWLIDAGEVSELAFVGGINITEDSMSEPGYPERGVQDLHDAYLELRGPAATDVHHNFVQRWNGASERDAPDGCWPDATRAAPLEFPSFVSPACGEVPVQITRTVRRGAYSGDTPAPGAKPFAIESGEQSVLEQYVCAIAGAERSVLIVNQALASPVVVDELRRALIRGVRVACIVPGNAHHAFVAARRDPRSAPFFAQLAELGEHERFLLAGLCASRGGGRYEEIYVHAKVAVVDDAWATVGSTNVASRSFRHDTELNASFWHSGEARALREALFANALGRPAEEADETGAFDALAETARRNLDRRAMWEPLDGFLYALDPARYGA
jgi:phosphatidylserine/phosphatidylglycerophosphate/cardiolipin synthase-like enzyme